MNPFPFSASGSTEQASGNALAAPTTNRRANTRYWTSSHLAVVVAVVRTSGVEYSLAVLRRPRERHVERAVVLGVAVTCRRHADFGARGGVGVEMDWIRTLAGRKV